MQEKFCGETRNINKGHRNIRGGTAVMRGETALLHSAALE